MQTFLPYPDFAKSAAVLDQKRLGQQRNECNQILNAIHQVRFNISMSEPEPIEGGPIPWENHAVTRMWRNYEVSLCEYGLIICEEWISRGYEDNVTRLIETHMELATSGDFLMEKPPWFGGPIHDQYKSLLIRKKPEYYRDKFPDISSTLEFVYPSNV